MKFLRTEDGDDASMETLHSNSTYWLVKSVNRCLELFADHGLEQFATEATGLDQAARDKLSATFGEEWEQRRLSIAADRHSVASAR